MVTSEFLNTSWEKPYAHNGTHPGEFMRCYSLNVVVDNGVWQELNPLAQSLPLFLLQLIIITAFTRLVILLLKPLRQPLIVAEILAGVLLGNLGLGMFQEQCPFLKTVFSLSKVMLLETFGNLGLIYYLFLLGLEMDLTTIHRIGKKAFTIAIAGTLFPFAFGSCLYYLCMQSQLKPFPFGFLFWGVSLSVTGLPVLADILANLKLLYTDFGRIAMSAALVSEIFSWALFVLVLSVIKGKYAPWLLMTTAIFVFFCIYVVRPAILWTIRRTGEGEEFSESTVCIILTAVLACGFMTDVIGMTSMVGAFVLGIVIPYEALGHRFVVVLQGFVMDLFMPVYFTLTGYRFQVKGFQNGPTWWVMVLTMVVLCVSKFATTMGAAYLLDVPVNEGATLGMLMNTKGLLAIIAINAGHDYLALDSSGFAIMFITIAITTMSTAPIMSILYRRTHRFLPSKHRSLQKLRSEAELRILTCVHEIQTVAGIINLLQFSHATRRSPICVFALQLIELTKQAAAFLIIHTPSCSCSLTSCSNRANSQTEQLIDAFEKLEHISHAISVQPLTAMSSYDTMHEDICSIAEDKRVNLVLLPFHKRQTIHNNMEHSNPSYKDVNDNVLANAPCSVAIFIDRGFGAIPDDNPDQSHHIGLLFIGGPDDREALAYAARIVAHPAVTLTVFRLVPGENALKMDRTEGGVSVTIYSESEKQIDDNYINEFRYKMANDNSVLYVERVSNNGDETVGIIRSIGVKFDLFVVGRGLGVLSPLTAGLAEWSECPELGPIGDLLLTSEFSSTASVLVVQQYRGLKGNDSDESTRTTREGFDEGHESLENVSGRHSRAHIDRFADEEEELEDWY